MQQQNVQSCCKASVSGRDITLKPQITARSALRHTTHKLHFFGLMRPLNGIFDLNFIKKH
eukprot:1191862-Pleurochrysis_carterae.AAC.2